MTAPPAEVFRSTLSPPALERYVATLLAHHFPDGHEAGALLRDHLAATMKRLEHCFSHIRRKYYAQDGDVAFDHLNSDHFASFLYLLANTIWRETGAMETPTRLFYLNKILHGLDLFYSVELPPVFMLVHPLGTVLGHARYGNYLVVYQNVTVGADATGPYPSFGTGTILYARSAVVGDCTLGDNVVLGANAFLLNTSVPPNSLVVGQYPRHRILPNEESVMTRVFAPA